VAPEAVQVGTLC